MRKVILRVSTLVVFVSICSTLARDQKDDDASCNGIPCRNECCNVMQYCSTWEICQSCESICDKRSLIRFWTYKHNYCEEKCGGYLARIFLQELRTTRPPILNLTQSPTQKPCGDNSKVSVGWVWSALSIIVFMALSLTLFLIWARGNLRKRRRELEERLVWPLDEPLVSVRPCRPKNHEGVSDLGYLRQDYEEAYTSTLISSYIRQSERSRTYMTPSTLLDIEESGSYEDADQAVEKQYPGSRRQDTPGPEAESRIPKSRDQREVELSQLDMLISNENTRQNTESISVGSNNFQTSGSCQLIPTVLQRFEPDGCRPRQPSPSRRQATSGNSLGIMLPDQESRDVVWDLSPSSPKPTALRSMPGDSAYSGSIDAHYAFQI